MVLVVLFSFGFENSEAVAKSSIYFVKLKPPPVTNEPPPPVKPELTPLPLPKSKTGITNGLPPTMATDGLSLIVTGGFALGLMSVGFFCFGAGGGVASLGFVIRLRFPSPPVATAGEPPTVTGAGAVVGLAF